MLHPSKIFGRLGNSLFQYAYIYAQMKRGNIPDLYLQDTRYFSGYEDDVKRLFNQGVQPINQVAIHVRRGDYVGNKFYVDLTETDYYDKAIKQFPSDRFLVFSDDIEFAKQYFTGEGFDFSEGNDEITDLNLMAGCKGHIITNSSFSWWGAFLSPFSTKIIAPKAWYTDKVERTKCPSNWIRL